ncbi:MAG: hypothetical protein IKO10_11100 [Lachnospiraceae bacterium]|nr:hypothetical protein [Lachnospiraceae bacterium]
MKTLIVPCAGKSSRFSGMPPKWLLKYPDGSLMVRKAMDGLPLNAYDRIIVTAVKEHVEAYDVNNKLDIALQGLPCDYELCVLEEFTSCQAETVYKTLKKFSVTGSFSVKDSDNYIKIKDSDNADFVAGVDMHKFPREIERLSSKSFLMVNDQGIITDIIEKKIVSQFISIGMYGFSSTDLFCEAFEHLAETKGMANEIYLSHVISYLIGTKKSVYSYNEADDYEDWGTKKDWYKVLKDKSTYFVNVEDIIVKKNSDDETSIILNDENVEFLKTIFQKGSQIILLSAQDQDYLSKIERKLGESGIDIHASVSGCYLSHQRLFKSFSEEIPYPSCEAYNIKADDRIGALIREEE